ARVHLQPGARLVSRLPLAPPQSLRLHRNQRAPPVVRGTRQDSHHSSVQLNAALAGEQNVHDHRISTTNTTRQAVRQCAPTKNALYATLQVHSTDHLSAEIGGNDDGDASTCC